MSTGATWQIKSTSSEQTEQLGQRLGSMLKGGEVIELESDLGGGKTTFVRGLALGAGSDDKVASPTFTISKVYKAPSFDIHHFDFYRLHEAGIMASELADLLGDPKTVVVVEWGDAVAHVLPPARITIRIQQMPTGDRELTFRAPANLSYLKEGLS